jgi:hypothetical protein
MTKKRKYDENSKDNIDNEEDNDSTTNPSTLVRANDIIDLIFIEEQLHPNLNSYAPTFTHQLFEDEIFPFENIDRKKNKVKIYIMTSGML